MLTVTEVVAVCVNLIFYRTCLSFMRFMFDTLHGLLDKIGLLWYVHFVINFAVQMRRRPNDHHFPTNIYWAPVSFEVHDTSSPDLSTVAISSTVH
jgi:hypothetical protein